MEETIIIRSKTIMKSIAKKIIIVAVIITVIFFVIFGIRDAIFQIACNKRDKLVEEALREGREVTWEMRTAQVPIDYLKTDNYMYAGCAFGAVAILSTVFYLYISKMEIVVTNSRVYGQCAFGKRVDLPLDTISAVGTSFLQGIDVGTSAGKIKFKGISNNKKIHEEISDLLNNRQNNKSKQEQVKTNNTSIIEELKQYKELLDNGVITQEEFDAKKNQILGL